jgi:hypothetical protein
VAGLTGGRGCHNLFRHDAQPRVTAITGMRDGDTGRMGSWSATRRRVRGARTAHSIHRREVGPATTGVWSSDAVIIRRYTQACERRGQPSRMMPDHVEVRVASPEPAAGVFTPAGTCPVRLRAARPGAGKADVSRCGRGGRG